MVRTAGGSIGPFGVRWCGRPDPQRSVSAGTGSGGVVPGIVNAVFRAGESAALDPAVPVRRDNPPRAGNGVGRTGGHQRPGARRTGTSPRRARGGWSVGGTSAELGGETRDGGPYAPTCRLPRSSGSVASGGREGTCITRPLRLRARDCRRPLPLCAARFATAASPCPPGRRYGTGPRSGSQACRRP